MGWANCGHDSKGRRIGYAFPAKCDEPGCKARIDRGLGYACGGMHGDSDGCEGYFCGSHLTYRYDPCDERSKQFCARCAANLDGQRAEDFTDALFEVVKSADPVATALAALAAWGEAPSAWGALAFDDQFGSEATNAAEVVGRGPGKQSDRADIAVSEGDTPAHQSTGKD